MKTYWSGEPTLCRRVRVVVGKAQPGWWCAGLEGTIREAVRVDTKSSTFYLDNENGSAWGKVTGGRGSPKYGHRSLPVEREIEEPRDTPIRDRIRAAMRKAAAPSDSQPGDK